MRFDGGKCEECGKARDIHPAVPVCLACAAKMVKQHMESVSDGPREDAGGDPRRD